MTEFYGQDQVRMLGEKSLDVCQANAAQFEGGLLGFCIATVYVL